jgi:hypothetical protein
MILPSQMPECWDYSNAPPSLAKEDLPLSLSLALSLFVFGGTGV